MQRANQSSPRGHVLQHWFSLYLATPKYGFGVYCNWLPGLHCTMNHFLIRVTILFSLFFFQTICIKGWLIHRFLFQREFSLILSLLTPPPLLLPGLGFICFFRIGLALMCRSMAAMLIRGLIGITRTVPKLLLHIYVPGDIQFFRLTCPACRLSQIIGSDNLYVQPGRFHRFYFKVIAELYTIHFEFPGVGLHPGVFLPLCIFFTVWMPTRAKSTSQASGTISGASPVGFAMGRLQCRPNAIITRGQNCNWGTIIRGSVARTVPLLVTIYWVWSRTKNIRVVMLHWSPPDKNHRAK